MKRAVSGRDAVGGRGDCPTERGHPSYAAASTASRRPALGETPPRSAVEGRAGPGGPGVPRVCGTHLRCRSPCAVSPRLSLGRRFVAGKRFASVSLGQQLLEGPWLQVGGRASLPPRHTPPETPRVARPASRPRHDLCAPARLSTLRTSGMKGPGEADRQTHPGQAAGDMQSPESRT